MPPLAPKSNLAVSVCNHEGTIVWSSASHAHLLDRNLDQIVGRNWREWNSRSVYSHIEELLSRSLSGEPTEVIRPIIRPDGTFLIAQATMMLLEPNRDAPLVMAMHKTLLSAPELRAAVSISNGFGVAEYIADLVEDLAGMSNRAGLCNLGGSLEEIAAQAGHMSEILDSTRHPRH